MDRMNLLSASPIIERFHSINILGANPNQDGSGFLVNIVEGPASFIRIGIDSCEDVQVCLYMSDGATARLLTVILVTKGARWASRPFGLASLCEGYRLMASANRPGPTTISIAYRPEIDPETAELARIVEATRPPCRCPDLLNGHHPGCPHKGNGSK